MSLQTFSDGEPVPVTYLWNGTRLEDLPHADLLAAARDMAAEVMKERSDKRRTLRSLFDWARP